MNEHEKEINYFQKEANIYVMKQMKYPAILLMVWGLMAITYSIVILPLIAQY
jgi:type II secretory pathway component PulF